MTDMISTFLSFWEACFGSVGLLVLYVCVVQEEKITLANRGEIGGGKLGKMGDLEVGFGKKI